jgi:hypothetical protein
MALSMFGVGHVMFGTDTRKREDSELQRAILKQTLAVGQSRRYRRQASGRWDQPNGGLEKMTVTPWQTFPYDFEWLNYRFSTTRVRLFTRRGIATVSFRYASDH